MGVVPQKAESGFSLILDVEMDDSSETKVSFSHTVEIAAENDVERFEENVELNPVVVDEVGLWYGRQAGSKGIVSESRTPLMVASMYGSLDVMKVILSLSEADVNFSCGADKITAFHCAACGGFADAVKLLLVNGADVDLVDSKGNRPYDVIAVRRNQSEVCAALEQMLNGSRSCDEKDLQVLVNGVNGVKVSPLTIPSRLEDQSLVLEVCQSSVGLKSSDTNGSVVPKKKEYPVDSSLLDIKNSIYTTDEFRMYSFKVRPCSQAYSHDWTECPFVHPGENARRRDQGSFTIVVSLVQSFAKAHADAEICLSMLMVCSSVGYTQRSTGPGCAKMEPAAIVGFASLHTFPKNSGLCMHPLGLLSRCPDQWPPLLL